MTSNNTRYMTVQVVAPLYAHRTVEELIKAYADDMKLNGAKGEKGWDETTFNNRMSDLLNLAKAARGAICENLDLEIFDRAINFPGTSRRSNFVRKQTDACLKWGVKHGWITEEQRRLLQMPTFKAPEGYKDTPSRRHRAKLAGEDKDLYQGGDVPTHGQVAEWADTSGTVYVHGVGLVYLAAYLGPRIDELLACTADREVARRGQGNLVAVEQTLEGEETTIRIARQVGGRHGALELPKADVVRVVVVPHVSYIETGFDVRSWLNQRVEQALAEQKAGTNPLALIFPGPKGGYQTYDSYHKRVFTPTMKALGWPVFEVKNKYGAIRKAHRFTTHSLRRHWVVTAVDEWRYEPKELKQQGGWLNDVTPMRWYHGITDNTRVTVTKRMSQPRKS